MCILIEYTIFRICSTFSFFNLLKKIRDIYADERGHKLCPPIFGLMDLATLNNTAMCAFKQTNHIPPILAFYSEVKSLQNMILFQTTTLNELL